jgi:hypothetical protein
LHLYDQRPKDAGKGALHHLGFRTNDLNGLHRRLLKMGAVRSASSGRGDISCVRLRRRA